jgi:hypothetical protein
MSDKADFNADEWDLLRSAPVMASLLVVAASPSGPVGLVQETTAAGRVILQTRRRRRRHCSKSCLQM